MCYNYSKLGHFASECQSKEKEQTVHVAEKEDDDPALLLAETCELVQLTHEAGIEVMLNEERVHPGLGNEVRYESLAWYLDTGASNHMIGNKAKFTDLDTTVRSIVKFGDGSTVKICGCGTVLFECHNGEYRALTEVYYIPRLKSNIVSLGQLEENGYQMVLEDGHMCIFYRRKKMLAKVKQSSQSPVHPQPQYR